ncbi:MAG: coiled coil domain-containing protein [Geminicoccaceae bacterium]|nr:MAG: coiled coil domain-containing protein [Geminicoccaceae bacterium]
MSERQAYQEKLEAQLKIWEAEIDKLRAQAEKANAETKAQYFRQLDNLYAQHDEARQRYHEMVRAGEDNWREWQAKSEAAWKDIADGVKAAWDRFR